MSNWSFIDDYFNHKRLRGSHTVRCHQNLQMNAEGLYSFGMHFPLAIETVFGGYILNGDTYSSTTSAHQSDVRFRVANHRPKVAYVEIPFSVMESAGIDPKQVEIINRKDASYRNVRYKDGAGAWQIRQQHLLGGCLVRVRDKYHTKRYRYFLSGTDEGASWGWGYYLTELPESVATVRDAFKSLMPNVVQEAKRKGKVVKRQGEWFFVAVGNTKKFKKFMEKSFVIPFTVKVWVLRKQLLPCLPHQEEGHHLVRELITTTTARMFCRGTVRHTGGEHKMLKLGEVWYEAFPNRQVRSWTSRGRVD